MYIISVAIMTGLSKDPRRQNRDNTEDRVTRDTDSVALVLLSVMVVTPLAWSDRKIVHLRDPRQFFQTCLELCS